MIATVKYCRCLSSTGIKAATSSLINLGFNTAQQPWRLLVAAVMTPEVERRSGSRRHVNKVRRVQVSDHLTVTVQLLIGYCGRHHCRSITQTCHHAQKKVSKKPRKHHDISYRYMCIKRRRFYSKLDSSPSGRTYIEFYYTRGAYDSIEHAAINQLFL